MNITRALDVALPELPAKLVGQRYPRIHPEVAYKEHLEEGERIVKAVVPGVDAMFTFPPENWKLIQLFDGQRSYEEIAEIYTQETGVEYSTEVVRDFADQVDAMNFWYKTAQEKNIKMMQHSADERRKLLQKKSMWGDLSMIKFPAFNPDRFLTWLYKYVAFMYTPWFTVMTLLGFAFTIWIFVTHWGEIGRDTVEFYNFADKSWADVAFFWVAGSFLLAVHETAHGISCKHYGARVPAMGFLLIYLTPAFYTDTTEGEALANQWQRLVITVSGVWSELILCAVVTPLWWGTAPGTALHDACYVIILFTGIAVVFVNWNPLMKLDGYYILCELVGVQELKEQSTLYLSSWVKKYIWRLPVEVPYVPKRRRLGFMVYAALSGMYSYTVLYVFASFIGNIFRNFFPEWAFVFELGTAYMIFSGRIRTFLNFMKFLYLDKRDRILAWFTPQRRMVAAAVTVVFALLPIFHESADGRFVLEPAQHGVVRALVPGLVTNVYVEEGQRVSSGAPLLRLENLQLESKVARSVADYQIANARATSAAMHYADFGPLEQERERLARQSKSFASERAQLSVSSPLDGIVLTPRIKDRLGAYVEAGTELAEVGDVGTLRARIYVSEHDMNRINSGSYARLHLDGMFERRVAQSITISQMATPIEPGLMDLSKYKGMGAPNFYVVDLLVANGDGRLMPGMVGTARVYGRRRSLAGLAFQGIADFVGRKIW